jgi:hypothetical protein
VTDALTAASMVLTFTIENSRGWTGPLIEIF